ncbi:hypothetical protein ACHAQJ_007149 [Trichoderma viride]
MDSKVTAATVQATVLNALSGTVDDIDLSSILRFIVYTVLTTPPNYRWQEFLEQTFPTTTEAKEDKSLKDKPSHDAVTVAGGKLNIANTVAKFILDQALGAPVNTLLFICLMGQMNLQGYDRILNSVVSPTESGETDQDL